MAELSVLGLEADLVHLRGRLRARAAAHRARPPLPRRLLRGPQRVLRLPEGDAQRAAVLPVDEVVHPLEARLALIRGQDLLADIAGQLLDPLRLCLDCGHTSEHGVPPRGGYGHYAPVFRRCQATGPSGAPVRTSPPLRA